MKNTATIKENIDSQQLGDALSERYLSYAVSTIVSRALPDVRDGLKPVHRRILFSMLRQKLSPNAAFRKCATVVGDVLGHYHPHGDSSVYDAMVRLAQDFSVRYPLIDGQGNFGNIDGDPQAAYRYTESKMTEAAMMIMEGIDEDMPETVQLFGRISFNPHKPRSTSSSSNDRASSASSAEIFISAGMCVCPTNKTGSDRHNSDGRASLESKT